VASESQHTQKAEGNERFVESLLAAPSPFLDWAVTGLFYSALHYCRAVMARNKFTNVSTYPQEDRLFATLAPLKRRPDIFSDYRALKDDSRAVRYDMWGPSLNDVADLRSNEFTRVRQFARTYLGLPP
jgi:hypothetical protein